MLRPAHAVPAGGGVTPAFVWQVVARWWTLVLPAGLILGAGGAAIAWLTFKPSFVAEAWLRIEDRRPFVAFPSAEESKRFVETQLELLRSPVVTNNCLSRPEIAQLPELKAEESPTDWLSKRLSVSVVGQSELFRIRFEGPNPKNAAMIANSVVDAYIDMHSDKSKKETVKIVEALEAEKRKRMLELERLQESVRDLTKQVTGKDLAIAGQKAPDPTVAANPLAAIEDRLVGAQVSREVLEWRLQVAKDKLSEKRKAQIPKQALEQAVANDPGVRKLTEDLMAVEQELEEYANTVVQGKQQAAQRRLQSRKLATEEALAKRQKEVRELRTAELEHGLFSGYAQVVEDLEEQLDGARREEKLLRDRFEAARVQQSKSGDKALDLEFLRNEMQRSEDVFRRISDRITALSTEKEAPSRISQLHPASPPNQPKSSPYKLAGMAGAGLFVLPLALALLWEFRVRRITNCDDIPQQTQLRVLGEVTNLPVRSLLPGRRSRSRFQQELSTFEESVAYLRTSLLLDEDAADLQVLAVTSAVSQEGKTSVAAKLAANIAEVSGQPTILIDADLRSPSLHDLFEIPLEPGLAEVLSGEASLDEVIVGITSGPVQVIPAGRLTTSATHLFGNDSFHELLSTLRLQYRYVVVDCPPLLAASEALVVAKEADGTLLCTMRDISQFSKVRVARDRLMAAGARPLGVVLSGVPAKKYAARYGRYYATTNHGGISDDAL